MVIFVEYSAISLPLIENDRKAAYRQSAALKFSPTNKIYVSDFTKKTRFSQRRPDFFWSKLMDLVVVGPIFPLGISEMELSRGGLRKIGHGFR